MQTYHRFDSADPTIRAAPRSEYINLERPAPAKEDGKMTSRLRTVAVGLFTWTLFMVVASGQTGTPQTQLPGPAIEGTIVDASGAPIPGVTVTLEQNNTPVFIVVTDVAGKFRFDNPAAGAYTLTATLTGFKRLRQAVTVGSSGVVTLSLKMEVGGLEETVEVKAAAPMVDTRRTSTGFVRQGATVTDMAWSGQRGLAGRYAPLTNTEDYAAITPNAFNLTSAEPLSTFAADVDTASYTNVRRFLNDGQLPPVDAVRVEEFVNYFHYQYPEPTDEHPVSITTEVGAAPWAPDRRLVLVGVRAKPIDQRAAGRRNIVLLIDVSGSMGSPDKLPLVKTGLRMFADTLRDDDRLAIVVYAGASGLVLPPTSGRQRARIHDAIERLHAGGSTNGAQGLQLAYKVADDEFVAGGINRVILATDGDFNVGVTSQGDLLRLIEEKKRTGIFLSVLGVGTGNLKDSTMEMLADKGNGHYAYLDSLHEARRVLVREGGATLETVAKDVKFQVEFNPATVAAWKLIGYENRLLAHRDFNDDAKDGGELGAGHTVTVLYEVVPVGVELPEGMTDEDGRPVVDPLTYQSGRQATGNRRDLLTVKVRYKQPDQDVSALLAQPVRDDGEARALPFAAAVAEFGLLLRDAEPNVDRWTRLADRLRALPVGAGGAADRQGLLDLVELAASLRSLQK
jgi:Ca-activated chloride channel family protein